VVWKTKCSFFSVVAVELLPEIERQHAAVIDVVIGFSLGVAVLRILRSVSHRLEKNGDERPFGVLVGVGIDVLCWVSGFSPAWDGWMKFKYRQGRSLFLG
jgi:hypothetical protein